MTLGVMLVFFGLLWLLAEAGVLPSASGVWRLWPLLVMALGFDLVSGRSPHRRVLAGLAAAALVLLGLFWVFMPSSGNGNFTEREVHIPLAAGVSEANLSIRTQIANLDISPSPAGNQDLLSGHFQLYRDEKLPTKKRQHGNVAYIDVTSKTPLVKHREGPGPYWRVWLSRKPLYRLDFSLAVGNTRLDLRGLQVASLELDTQVGNATVYLPDHSGSFAISSGTGNLTVYLPPRVAVSLNINKGVGSLEVRGLEGGGGNWRRGNGPTLKLQIGSRVGRVRVLPAP